MISHVCPEEIRTRNRRNVLKDIWNSPEWIALTEQYLKEHPVCDWCGKPSQVVHHFEPDAYLDMTGYMDFTQGKVVAVCNRCHENERRGLVICPICKKHYTHWKNDRCKYCLPKEQRQKLAADRRVKKAANKAKREAIKEAENARAREFRNEMKRKGASNAA